MTHHRETRDRPRQQHGIVSALDRRQQRGGGENEAALAVEDEIWLLLVGQLYSSCCRIALAKGPCTVQRHLRLHPNHVNVSASNRNPKKRRRRTFLAHANEDWSLYRTIPLILAVGWPLPRGFVQGVISCINLRDLLATHDDAGKRRRRTISCRLSFKGTPTALRKEADQVKLKIEA